MISNPHIDMAEATRLTREGRLQEAMAVLQGKPASVTTPGSRRDAGHPQAPNAEPIDMIAPTPGSGGAWTAPEAQPAAPAAANPAPATAKPRGPLARSLIDKLRSMPLAGARRKGQVAASAVLPDGAHFDSHTFSGGGEQRDYRLYVPGSHRDRPLPLVVMLHGCTQSPEDFAAGTGMNALAEAQGFLVAYPAQPSSANGSRCWNWFNAGDQQRDRGEPALIAGITRQVMGQFAVDPARVYVAGLSAGGAAAAIMARTYPDLYAAIGVHSGLACGAATDVASAFSAMRQGGTGVDTGSDGGSFPTIVFHGDKDRTVSPINGVQVMAQSRGDARLQVTDRRGSAPGGQDYTCTVETDDNGHPVLEHWLLHGGGHAWSGGSDAGSYTDPRGPDASREMMRFFLQHSGPTAP